MSDFHAIAMPLKCIDDKYPCYQEQLPYGVCHVSPGFAELQTMSLGLAVKLGPDGEGLIQAVNTSAEEHGDGDKL